MLGRVHQGMKIWRNLCIDNQTKIITGAARTTTGKYYPCGDWGTIQSRGTPTRWLHSVPAMPSNHHEWNGTGANTGIPSTRFRQPQWQCIRNRMLRARNRVRLCRPTVDGIHLVCRVLLACRRVRHVSHPFRLAFWIHRRKKLPWSDTGSSDEWIPKGWLMGPP